MCSSTNLLEYPFKNVVLCLTKMKKNKPSTYYNL